MAMDRRIAILLRDLAALDRQRAALQVALADELDPLGACDDSRARLAETPAEGPPCKSAKPRRGRAAAPLVAAPVAPPDEVTAARARQQLQRLGFRRG